MSIDIEIGMFPLHLHHRGVLLKMGKLLLGAAQAVSRRDKKKKKKRPGEPPRGRVLTVLVYYFAEPSFVDWEPCSDALGSDPSVRASWAADGIIDCAAVLGIASCSRVAIMRINPRKRAHVAL